MVAGQRAENTEEHFKMKIDVIEHKEDRIRFKISGIDVTLANALRRIIISEIPVMAIENVTFEENSSILNDEVLAHRLALVPLKTDLKTYNFVDECSCEMKGCAKCTAKLKADLKGPGILYSKDLKSNDPKVIPVHGSMPLVKLTEQQKVKFEANAILGVGKDHMKWQCGLASYEMKKDDFDFFVESYGQLPAKEILERAFKIFDDKLSHIKKLKV